MPKLLIAPPSPVVPPSPEQLALNDIRDACDTAVFRLNVVLRIMGEFAYDYSPYVDPHADPADDTGGAESRVIADLLRDIRDELRAASDGGEQDVNDSQPAARTTGKDGKGRAR